MIESLDAMEARQDGMMEISMPGLTAPMRLLCMKRHGRDENAIDQPKRKRKRRKSRHLC